MINTVGFVFLRWVIPDWMLNPKYVMSSVLLLSTWYSLRVVTIGAFVKCFAIILLTLITADSVTAAGEPSQGDSRAIISSIDVNSGITPTQARAIVQLYFRTFISGCGGAEVPIDKGERWEVKLLSGFAGAPLQAPVVVDKHGGVIARKGGPEFKSLGEFLTAVDSAPLVQGSNPER